MRTERGTDRHAFDPMTLLAASVAPLFGCVTPRTQQPRGNNSVPRSERPSPLTFPAMWGRGISTFAGVVVVGALAPAAQARAAVVFRVPTQVNSGASTPFTWSVQPRPRRTALVLQKQEGTRHV